MPHFTKQGYTGDVTTCTGKGEGGLLYSPPSPSITTPVTLGSLLEFPGSRCLSVRCGRSESPHSGRRHPRHLW